VENNFLCFWELEKCWEKELWKMNNECRCTEKAVEFFLPNFDGIGSVWLCWGSSGASK
jgi:hypothetical protein